MSRPGARVDVVGGDPRQRLGGVLADKLVLGEGRLVEQPDRLAHRRVLLADRVEPVAAAEGVVVARIVPGAREPVGPLPAEFRAEHGALRLQPLVERRDDARPAALVFLEREGDGVVLAVGLERPLAGPGVVAVELGEAADVDDPEVHRLLALRHPVGEHPAGAAGRGDAEGVEAGADEEVPHLRRLAEDEVAVGRERFRPVDHLLDAGLLQRRDARHRRGQVLLEMIPVVVEELELETLRHDVEPRDRVGLVAAEGEAADLLLEVGPPVGIADRRHAGNDAVDLLGHHVLMLHRLERHADPGQRADLARPHAGAEHHLVAGDRARRGLDAGDPPVLDDEAGAADALVQLGAMHPRALGQRLGDVGGAGLPVARHEGRADEVVDLEERPQRLRLGRRQEVHVEAEAPRRRRLALELGPAVLVAGEPEAPGLAPAGGEAGLGLEPLVEVDRVAEHLGDRGRRAELADQARRHARSSRR